MDHHPDLHGQLDLLPGQLQTLRSSEALSCTVHAYKFWDLSFQFAKNNSGVLLPLTLGQIAIPNTVGADPLRGYSVDITDGHTITVSATPLPGHGTNYACVLTFHVAGLRRYDLFRVQSSPRGNNSRCRIVLRVGGHLAVDKTNIDSAWTSYSLDMLF